MSVGLNKYIDSAITILENNLWDGFNNSYNGRSFRLKNKNKVHPAIYEGNNNYTEVFPTNKYDSIVHFDADPVRPKISTQQATANVNIIFAVNLGEIYGSSTRASEEALKDINKQLVKTAFQIENIVEFPDALSDYDIDEKEEHQFNMQPYYVVKFETTCNYGLNNACTVVTPTQYTFNLSSTSGGSAVSNIGDEGEYTVNAKRAISGYPITEVGYRFVRWLKNTLAITAQNGFAIFNMDQNIALIAEFIKTWTLIISKTDNGTVDPVSGTYTKDEGEQTTITATPSEGYEAVITDNSTPVSNPYTLISTMANNVIATFTAILVIIQDIFSEKPIKYEDKYIFENLASSSAKTNLNIVTIGDSITAYACGGDIWGEYLSTELNEDITTVVTNVAVTDRTTQDCIDNYASEVTPLYDSSKNNYVTILTGANDSLTAAQSHAKIKELADLAIADGFKVINIAMTDATTGGTRLLELASLLCYNPVGSYFLDTREITEYDCNNALYSCDGLHWTELTGTLVVDKMLSEYWDNEILINNNFTTIKKTQVTTFNNSNKTHLTIPKKIMGSSPFRFEHEFYYDLGGGVFSSGGSSVGSVKGISIKYTGGYLQIWIANGTDRISHLSSLPIFERYKWYTLIFDWDGVSATPTTLTANGKDFTLATGLIPWVGLSDTDSFIGLYSEYNGSPYYDKMNRIKVVNSELTFGLAFKEQQGSTAYDYINDNNATIQNNPIDFWDNTSEYAEPTPLTLGVTRYIKDSDSSELFICKDTSQLVTGFTRDAYYSAGSGILKGLSNKYLGVLNNPTVEQDFNTLDSITPSNIFIPTKPTVNNISQLIIKE